MAKTVIQKEMTTNDSGVKVATLTRAYMDLVENSEQVRELGAVLEQATTGNKPLKEAIGRHVLNRYLES